MNEYEFTTDWFEHHALGKWPTFFAPYKDQENVCYLEVGSYEGRSLIWVMENILTATTSLAVMVDPYLPSPDTSGYGDIAEVKERFLRNIKPFRQRIECNFELSHRALSRMMKRRELYFDVMYIDGDHRARGCLEDMVLAWRLLKVGGTMIVDDYLWQLHTPDYARPMLAVDSFLRMYLDVELVHKEYQVVFRKKGV